MAYKGVTQEEIDYYMNNLQAVVDRHLERSPKGGSHAYVCPGCGSGNGPNHTGAFMVYDRDSTGKPYYHCHSCKKHGRTIDLIYMLEGHHDFKKAIDTLRHEIGQQYLNASERDRNWTPREIVRPVKKEPVVEQAPLKDFSGFYWGSQQNLDRQGWSTVRGIPISVCKQYGVGFCGRWKSPGAMENPESKVRPAPYYILPYDKHRYFARAVSSRSIHPKHRVGTNFPFYLYEHMKRKEPKVMFVTEGEFDTLSVIAAGGCSVALGSSGRLKNFCKQWEQDKLPAVLVISVDNDKGGMRGITEAKEVLQNAKFPFMLANISGKYKDPNDYLQADPKGFMEAVQMVQKKALELYRALEKPLPSAKPKAPLSQQLQNEQAM